jgi:hypothetical protein
MQNVTHSDLEALISVIGIVKERLKEDVSKSHMSQRTASAVTLGLERVLGDGIDDACTYLANGEEPGAVIFTIEKAVVQLLEIRQLHEEPMKTRVLMMKDLTQAMLSRTVWGSGGPF